MTDSRDTLPFAMEDRLILAALRLDTSRDSAMLEALRQPVDWPSLRHRSIVHGVLPLVFARLAETAPGLVPAEMLDELRSIYDSHSRRVLRQTADLLKVARLFEDGGIPVISLKGPALAEQAFGDLASRCFADLDLLISPHDIARAQDILLGAGILFDAREKAPLPAGRLLAMKMKRHLAYRLSPQSTHIELHWQLGGYCYPWALPVAAFFARSEVRDIAGHPLRVLSREDLALHLCYHGAQHYWCKFSHLADFAFIMRQLDPSRWGGVLAAAREQRICRIFLTGLFLARRLLALPLPDEIARLVEEERACLPLARLVHAVLTRHAGEYPALPGQGKFRVLTSDSFRPPLRWLAGEIVPGIITPTKTDHQWLRLPRLLWGAYWLLRPVRQSIKLSHHLLQRKSTPFNKRLKP